MHRLRLLLAGETRSLLESLQKLAREEFEMEVFGPIARNEIEAGVRKHEPDAVLIVSGERSSTVVDLALRALLDRHPDLLVVGIDPRGNVEFRTSLLLHDPPAARILDLIRVALRVSDGARGSAAETVVAARDAETEAEAAGSTASATPSDEREREDERDRPQDDAARAAHAEDGYKDSAQHLVDELRWLDLVLREHLERESAGGAITATQKEQLSRPLARLRATTADAEHDFAERWRTTIERRVATSHAAGVGLRLDHVKSSFELDEFEAGCLLLALACAIDAKYRRICSALTLASGSTLPTSELLMSIFGREDFDPARLERHGRLRRHACLLPTELVGGEIAWSIDAPLADFILNENVPVGPDATRGIPAAARDLWVPDESVARVAQLFTHADTVSAGRREILVTVHGPEGSGRRALAERALAHAKVRGIATDAGKLCRASDLELALRRFTRCALLYRTALVFDRADALFAGGEGSDARLDLLLAAVRDHARIALFVCEHAWSPGPSIGSALHVNVATRAPRTSERAAIWSAESAAQGWELDRALSRELAAKFHLSPARIRSAFKEATANAVLARGASNPTRDELFEASRAQTGQGLAAYAARVELRSGWRDLVLAPPAKRMLRELVAHVECAPKVLDEWAFERALSRGRGVSALFSGPSGTGKTMAAEVVARRLGMTLWRIDLSRVLSKYIGETETRLREIFEFAEDSSILFFDEADALFGKRSEVHDSHDRYANVEVAYLLQLIEEYAGVAILATNLRRNLDDAFVRRLRFIVDFGMPDAALRERIWRQSLHSEVPLAADVDFAFLARRFEFAGGNIRNIGVHAAFLAAAERSSRVGMSELLRAAAGELTKTGQPFERADFKPYEKLLDVASDDIELELAELGA